MAATMSRVQQLALPSDGALRCEVALSHPQHGSSLLVGCHGSGGEGLQVADQEENEVMSVQVGGSSAGVQAVWQHAGADMTGCCTLCCTVLRHLAAGHATGLAGRPWQACSSAAHAPPAAGCAAGPQPHRARGQAAEQWSCRQLGGHW
jgi:hypothetical protein